MPGPWLIITIDTEEEFDWAHFSSQATSVTSIRAQEKAQKIFDHHNAVPCYLVDYPVASQPQGFDLLHGFLKEGRCTIGAHLHPWVNPPIDEEICAHNSFPGNLPQVLEFKKLEHLTKTIEQNFDTQPTIYRAGRYGAGSNTAKALKDLGYKVDVSVRPLMNASHEGGPDYYQFNTKPYWLDDEKTLLEIPLSAGLLGVLSGLGPKIYDRFRNPPFNLVRTHGILSRLNLLERMTLTPEGVRIDEALHLTRSLYNKGQQVFLMSYHSPSLEPGNTAYVRNENDLTQFLSWLDEYLNFFTTDLKGQVIAPEDFYTLASEGEK